MTSCAMQLCRWAHDKVAVCVEGGGANEIFLGQPIQSGDLWGENAVGRSMRPAITAIGHTLCKDSARIVCVQGCVSAPCWCCMSGRTAPMPSANWLAGTSTFACQCAHRVVAHWGGQRYGRSDGRGVCLVMQRSGVLRRAERWRCGRAVCDCSVHCEPASAGVSRSSGYRVAVCTGIREPGPGTPTDTHVSQWPTYKDRITIGIPRS